LTPTRAQRNHAGVILTELPDLVPRPLNPRNVAFRREFYRHWGVENCVVSGTSRHAEYETFRQTLSIKCVARGTESYYVDRREIMVSDDTFLVLNEGREYSSVLDAPDDTYSFAIFFRPGLAREVAGDLARSPGQALDDGALAKPLEMEFDETLRAHDREITPVLRFMQRQIAAGVRDEHWLEEQCQFLLARLILAQRKQHLSIPTELSEARPGKRIELMRRIGWATDYMHAHLADDISLQDIAAAARLSRFHFLRMFQLAHGRTPRTYLRDLRTRRALALLASTSLDTTDIAAQVGMSRIALWRSLRRSTGAGARQMRKLEALAAPVAFLAR
jgi:AraC family transcriptional regulator